MLHFFYLFSFEFSPIFFPGLFLSVHLYFPSWQSKFTVKLPYQWYSSVRSHFDNFFLPRHHYLCTYIHCTQWLKIIGLLPKRQNFWLAPRTPLALLAAYDRKMCSSVIWLHLRKMQKWKPKMRIRLQRMHCISVAFKTVLFKES